MEPIWTGVAVVKQYTGIQKGTKVFVVGELEPSSFKREDGKKWATFRVLADTYRILAGGRR